MPYIWLVCVLVEVSLFMVIIVFDDNLIAVNGLFINDKDCLNRAQSKSIMGNLLLTIINDLEIKQEAIY